MRSGFFYELLRKSKAKQDLFKMPYLKLIFSLLENYQVNEYSGASNCFGINARITYVLFAVIREKFRFQEEFGI